jgi:glycogen synthase
LARVLFWSESFVPLIGGLEVLASALLRSLGQRGHEFMVVTRLDWPAAPTDLPSHSVERGVRVHRLPLAETLASRVPARIMQVRAQVAELKRAFQPDLVHLYSRGPSTVFLRHTAKVHPAPLLVTLHGPSQEPELRPHMLFGSTLRSADWVTACSSSVLANARRYLPELAGRSSVVLNSLPAPALRPAPLALDSPRLLCLGRADRIKGFDLALTAFATIVRRWPAARLIVAGDGPARPALERQATALGLGEAVEFLGWVAPGAVAALINSASLLVLPSREEAFGLVALQAAQLGRPVVAARVGGLPEVVRHGETGLLVEPGNVPALAAAIASLLDQPVMAARLGRAARARARRCFGWDRHVDAYDALYRQLVGEAAAPAR